MARRMVHPALEGQPILVDEVAVPIHERSGWHLDDETQRDGIPGPAVPEVKEGFVELYHPQSQLSVEVPVATSGQYWQAGWLLRSEWDANEAERKLREDAARAAEAKARKDDSSKKGAGPAPSSKEE